MARRFTSSTFQRDAAILDLTIYDVIRTLFRREESMGVSSHTAKLFERLQQIIERHFTDPDFGPAELALEAGVSPRYLQKLFASRGTICNRYIESRRLERASKLEQRRIEQNGGPSIAEIAFASGYHNVNYFYSRFQQRFGRTPGALRADDTCIQTRDIVDPDMTPQSSGTQILSSGLVLQRKRGRGTTLEAAQDPK